jgi:uncharacterized protein YuzE
MIVWTESPSMPSRDSRSGFDCGQEDLPMNKPQMTYFADQDVLHITISDGPETRSMELTPQITAELNAKNELIGIEILQASIFIRDVVVESVQTRITQMRMSDPT